MFVVHPLIKPESIERREYQINIANTCKKQSTLVVLPTGMGKTVIAILVIADILESKGGKVLFMAPTKPLVEQHSTFLKEFLICEDITLFTGEVHPGERESLWIENSIVVSTPQVIRNDLMAGRISLRDVSLAIFDEAHRAVGEYAYVRVAEEYKEWKNHLVMGMTASPGNDVDKILEVCSNLGISAVEIRHEYDPDVVNYVHDIQIQMVRVDVSENMKRVLRLLQEAKEEQIKRLRKHGFLRTGKPVTRKDILRLGEEIQARLKGGEKNYHLYQAMSAQAVAMKIDHAIEMAETQGIEALRSYLERQEKEARDKKGTKASRTFLRDPKVAEASLLVRDLEFQEPKIEKVVQVVKDQFRRKEDSRVIVFTHYRDTSENVTAALEKEENIRPVRFVGQASKGEDRGLKQKEQVETIEKFKEGEYNVLVATSVAEEGLDIPSTDLVVLYEPVASEIRTIQRRGRTGRKRPGRVVGILYRGTRDEAYFYSAKRKEKRMYQELERLKAELSQRILVGGPIGSGFEAGMVSAEDIRRRHKVDLPKRRKPKRRREQTQLSDFT